MKKLKYLILSFIVLFLTIPNVKAAGIYTSASTVYPGQSFTASVTVNAAAWNVRISSTGPVSGCSIIDADASSTAMNISKTVSTTCTATGVGTITISLSGDYAIDSDPDNAIGLGGSATVQVVQQPAPQPQPQPQQPSRPQQPTNPQPAIPKSDNNYLKSLSVEGCSIEPKFNKDTLEYSCKDLLINEVEIKAEVEDSKSQISGLGKKELFNGDNHFEVAVTSESGQTRVYKLLINKRNIPSTKILKLTLGDKDYKIDDEIILFGLPAGTEKIDLKVTTDSTTANVNITGNDQLKPGHNIVNISVTDTDCKEKIYKVLVYVQEHEILENKNVESIDKDYIINLNKNAAYVLNKSILNNAGTKKVIYHIIDNNYGLLSSMEINSRQQLENDYELYFITKNNKVYTNIFEGTNVEVYFGNQFEIGEKLYIYAYDENIQSYILIDTKEYKDYYVSFKAVDTFEYLVTNKKVATNLVKYKKKNTPLSELIFIIVFQVVVMWTIVTLFKNKIKKKYEKEPSKETTEVPVITNAIEETTKVEETQKVEEPPKVEETTEKKNESSNEVI